MFDRQGAPHSPHRAPGCPQHELAEPRVTFVWSSQNEGLLEVHAHGAPSQKTASQRPSEMLPAAHNHTDKRAGPENVPQQPPWPGGAPLHRLPNLSLGSNRQVIRNRTRSLGTLPLLASARPTIAQTEMKSNSKSVTMRATPQPSSPLYNSFSEGVFGS